MRHAIQLSACILDLRHDPLRLPTRRLALRDADFEDEFDFTTLFNDVFWSDDNTHLVLIGPPLLNLREDLAMKFIALPGGTECLPRHERKVWMDQISLPVPAGTTGLVIECSSVRFTLSPQPGLCSLFDGRRVIFTESRNNDLQWISDWARFYVSEHGCDGILIYDNDSDRYELADIAAAVQSIDEQLLVVVVGWPFPYGVSDGRRELSYTLWDSFFSQATIFEHARRRFLMRARSVINTDIDELALSVPPRSIFEIAEQSQTGLVRYRGWWIENQFDTERPDRRHRDYCFRRPGRIDPTDCKWALVPQKCHDQAQWGTHNVFGMQPDAAGLDIHLRHFRAINTNWNEHAPLNAEPRTASFAGGAAELEADEALRESFHRVFGNEGGAGIARSDDRPDAVRAHALRVLAGRARAAGSQAIAAELAAEARRLLPDHPGIAGYLAELTAGQGETDEAAALEDMARSLRENAPAYHLQLGRAALARDAAGEGTEHLRRALELDPGFLEACDCLVANSDDAGARAALHAAVERCLQDMRPDDHCALALAAGLCLNAGMLAEALTAIERAIARNPHWSYLQLRAQILTGLGDTDAAIAAWKATIARTGTDLSERPYPDHESGRILPARLGAQFMPAMQYASLAGLLLHQGRTGEAGRAVEDGLKADPGSANLWLLRARVLALDNRPGEAVEAREKCRDLVSRSLADAEIFRVPRRQLIRLIDLMAGAGGHDEAASAIDMARRSGGADWRLEQVAGHLALERDDPDEAIACLRRALALNPHRSELHGQLARTLGAARRWSEAADAWADLIAIAPENAAAHAQRAMTLARLGDVDNAVAGMQRAIGLKGEEADWHVKLGSLLAQQEKCAAAAAALERAIALEPRHARAHRLLYEALEGLGRSEEALAAIRRAVALDGGIAHWHYELGALLARQEQWASAADACRKAIELMPDMARARRLLEECRRHQ